MKLTKLSLVAALLIGSSAFAIENTKVSGDVKLYYGTMDSDAANAPDMFDKDASYGDAALHLGLTTDLSEGVSAGVSVTAVSTLGLENNLVTNTWSNSHTISNSEGADFVGRLNVEEKQLDDAMWVDEAWIAGTALDTTVKVGRMTLDTPLAFTETWGIDSNTFEAAVLINQSLPGTTLIGAYVGKSNGSADDEATIASLQNISAGGATALNGVTLNAIESAQSGYVSVDGKFNTFGTDGVYVAGLINNSWKPLTVSAWYYDLQKMADAYWLQADVNLDGILAGAQYTEVDADKLIAGTDKDKAYALMLGYEMKDTMTVKVAYSSVDDEGTIGVANVATGGDTYEAGRNGSGAQSKLYTEMWWNYGAVSTTGADSYSLTVEATVGPEIELFAGYYYADINVGSGSSANANNDEELTEIALTASKSFGPLDTSLALIIDDFEDNLNSANDEKVTTLQVYLTYNF